MHLLKRRAFLIEAVFNFSWKSWNWSNMKFSLRQILRLWHIFNSIFLLLKQVWLLVVDPLEFQNFRKRNPANFAFIFGWIAFSQKQEKSTKTAEKEIDHCTMKNPKNMKTIFLQNFQPNKQNGLQFPFREKNPHCCIISTSQAINVYKKTNRS